MTKTWMCAKCRKTVYDPDKERCECGGVVIDPDNQRTLG